MKHNLLLMSLLIGASACNAAPDLDAARQALMDADRAFNQETSARGVDGWVSYFAEDGVQFVSGGHISGHEAIRELMTPALSDTALSLTWEPVSARVSSSGELGYTIGRWERRVTGPDGVETVVTGSYVSIWRLQEDGTWKVELDIGNPDER
ncbi:MAG: nuclear transport factor 2 family protein [Gemmatimonadota bacterium]|nr:MAG: nuclear transport factor 2 family protein [Gemmatimonadota bacterium]